MACVMACITAGSVLPAVPKPLPSPPALAPGRPSRPTSLVRADDAIECVRECVLPMLDMDALEERPWSRRLVEPYLLGG